MPDHKYTLIHGDGDRFWACNDCGAAAPFPDEIEHYPSCVPGESERWEKYYDEQDDDEDEYYPEEDCED